MTLLPVPSLETISDRLALIFPEGTELRGYLTRDVAAKTVFVMFYVGAVEGVGGWVRPSQVTDMGPDQAALLDEKNRLAWISESLRKKKNRPASTWYAANSREQVRDETIKDGFIPLRAVVVRPGIPTTSDKPRYALERDFAALFSEDLQGGSLEAAIQRWQASHLSKAARSRQALVKQTSSDATSDHISVVFPNGESRRLAPGPSSVIAKAVIEVFAPLFLKSPAVLWLSESGNKVVARDEILANSLGLKIDQSKALPDIILVDLGAREDGGEMLVVFAEIVATDGPVSRERKVVLTALATEAGFDDAHLAFLTAYADRAESTFKKNVDSLAWGSFVWFVSEPQNLVQLHGAEGRKLFALARPS